MPKGDSGPVPRRPRSSSVRARRARARLPARASPRGWRWCIWPTRTTDARSSRANGWSPRKGRLRRWDGFVARGEGAAEAARLEAENRFAGARCTCSPRAARSGREPPKRRSRPRKRNWRTLQRTLVAAEREVQQAAEAERQALRASTRPKRPASGSPRRREELAVSEAGLAEQRQQAEGELAAAKDRRAALPDPETGRTGLAAAQARHEAAARRRCRPPRRRYRLRTIKRSPWRAGGSPRSAPTCAAAGSARRRCRDAAAAWSGGSRKSPRSARRSSPGRLQP